MAVGYGSPMQVLAAFSAQQLRAPTDRGAQQPIRRLDGIVDAAAPYMMGNPVERQQKKPLALAEANRGTSLPGTSIAALAN